MSNIKIVTVEQAKEELMNGTILEQRGPKHKSSRKFQPPTVEELEKQYLSDEALREQTLKEKIPFINHSLSGNFYLSPGLILIGGVSGKGKSTAVANIQAGYLESASKKTLVITNEENLAAQYNRIACVRLNVNYNLFHHSMVSPKVTEAVRAEAKEVMKRVTVVDDDAWDMTCLEDVQSVFDYAASDPEVGLISIDYLQTVTTSRDNPHMESFSVSKSLGLYLKDYGKRVGKPVLVFAQIKSQAKDSAQKLDFKDRVENDRTFFNHAFQAIEIIPDFEAQTTTFKVHKDRFGTEPNREFTALYKGGKYEAYV